MDESTFLQAILDEPEDDGLRLIFADWLEERGDARGEFIRVQCELARMPAKDARRRRLQERERALLYKHERRWLGPLRGLLRWSRFRRGFLDEVLLGAEAFVKNAELLFQLMPVTHVHLHRANAVAPLLARCPHLARVLVLSLSYNHFTDAAVQALAASPYLRRLKALYLRHNFIRNAGAEALAGAPALAGLTWLDLTRNRIGQAGRQALQARFGERVRFG
jgi:uncharacterized protein (TIGR02996 family)